MFKNRGDGLWEKGGNFEKKCKRHKCHPKLNLHSKFHLNRIMEKCSKTEGIVFGEEGRGKF